MFHLIINPGFHGVFRLAPDLASSLSVGPGDNEPLHHMQAEN